MLRLNHLDGLGVRFANAFRVWLDPSVLTTMRQDRLGASAVIPAAANQPVGSMLNLGTAGGWYTAPSDAARPTLRTGAGLWWLEFPATSGALVGANPILRNVQAWTLASAIRLDLGTGATQEASAGTSTARASLWYADVSSNVSFRLGSRRLNADSALTLNQVGSVTPLIDTTVVGVCNYAAQTRTLFINGAQNTTATNQGTVGSSAADQGVHTVGNNTPRNSAMRGRLYLAAVAERALSAAEVSELEAILQSKMTPTVVEANVLLVGAGGTGNSSGGGGGGVVSSLLALAPGDYPVVIGAGHSTFRTKGADSTAFGLTAIGGGFGGGWGEAGGPGGSGGGGGAEDSNVPTGPPGAGGSGVSGQGFSGAAAEGDLALLTSRSGGGGGAGGAASGENGGVGLSSSIRGTPELFGAGGPGLNISAEGSAPPSLFGRGARNLPSQSGVLILRWRNAPTRSVSYSGTHAITTVLNDRVLTITGSGTLTVS